MKSRLTRHICRAMALMAMFPSLAGAQTRFEQVYDRNFFLTGNNIAGMRCDSVNISTAALGAGYVGGENRLLSEAPDAWHAGIKAETIMHRERFSMYGALRFRQDMGYGMCGSMMMQPGFFPVGVSEYTPGRKSKQTYAFTGGASIDLASRWRLGTRLDYEAANCAKLKDLRYTDHSMQLGLHLGTQYLATNGLTVGASALLSLDSETVTAEQIGESNTSYYAFLNKGAWWGTRQVWTGGGLHLSESGISGFPIMQMGVGASAQISWKKLYAELAYVRKAGHVGEKDAIWYNFPTNRVSATIAYRWRSRRGVVHTFAGDAAYMTRDLDETVLDKVTEGGVTLRRDYGSNRIQRSKDFTFSRSWKAEKEGLFSAKVGLQYENESMTATIQYPRVCFYRLQKFGGNASLTWFFPLGWSIDAAIFAGGSHFKEDNWSVSAAVETTTEPYRSESEYENWKFHNTIPYFGVNFAPRYTFPFHLYLSPYAGCEWKVAPIEDRQYRVAAGLTLGYTF